MAKASTKTAAANTPAAALAAIKAQRDTMNAEQAALEIPLLEEAIATIEEHGTKLLEALQLSRDAVIHPMAKEQINNIFIVINSVPVALNNVIGEHSSVIAPPEPVLSPTT